MPRKNNATAAFFIIGLSLLGSLVPSTVGRNRLDHKAIAPISIARAQALVLDVIAVLPGTPRGIELCECRCILPELVWRLQRLPCNDIAATVQLQANDLKHEAAPSSPPAMTLPTSGFWRAAANSYRLLRFT
jgi:hypothetical protein